MRRASSCELPHHVETERGRFRWNGVGKIGKREEITKQIIIIINIYIFTAIGLLPSSSAYFTCIQNMKLVTNKFKSGGLHEKHVVATWNLGNHLSICF